MEQIYTIPVNEAFEKSRDDASCGCPFCALSRKLEANELDLILGASMMEPDIRVKTNELGFCQTHYSLMMKRGKRLPLALMLESHLASIRDSLKVGMFPASSGASAEKRLSALNSSCYICERVEYTFSRMLETAALLWQQDEDFRAKVLSQPYFCIPHYERFLHAARERHGKRGFGEFYKAVSEIENKALDKLSGDISWFCKKFDYRYENEPWNDAKDAIERTMLFLNGDPDVSDDAKN